MSSRHTGSASIKTTLVLSLILIILALGTASVQKISRHDQLAATVDCSSQSSRTKVDANCTPQRQPEGLTWKNWFTGQSHSIQFHFVDLLELLQGRQEHHSTQDTSPGSGSGQLR